MAKNNPWLAVEKLRQESGADEIIVGSYTQNEPAISYKLGSSTMAVDMTGLEWPLTGKGIVNTSRASSSFATQTFQPLGTSVAYQRRWDATPIDYSDPFEGNLGASYNTDKWQRSTDFVGQIADIQDANGLRSLRLDGDTPKSGLVSKFYFASGANDFDIQVLLNRTSANTIGGPSIVVGSKASLMGNTGYGDFNDDIFGVMCNSATYRCFTYGDTDGFSTYTANPVTLRSYFRLTKVGSTVTIYRKQNIGDDWITVRTSTGMGATFNSTDLYVKLMHGQTVEACYFDDFIINSYSALIEETPSDAHWSSWTEVKSAEEQLSIAQNEATTAVTTHETSYDHTTFKTDGLTRTRVVYVDDAGGNTEIDTTTTFTSIADVDLFINGLRMLAGNEFTDSATTPNAHITLTAATVAGDDVEIIVWKVQ